MVVVHILGVHWARRAEFCFDLYSSIFLGGRPMVQEQPARWHCSGGGSGDTGGSMGEVGHETWVLLPRRLRKEESTGWGKHLDNT